MRKIMLQEQDHGENFRFKIGDRVTCKEMGFDGEVVGGERKHYTGQTKYTIKVASGSVYSVDEFEIKLIPGSNPAEKYAERINAWKNPSGIEFASAEVEKAYAKRVQMIVDATELRKPERTPIVLDLGSYPCHYAGVTPKEAMYNFESLGHATRKFNADFLLDTLTSARFCGPGKVLEILDYCAGLWAGHGLPDNIEFQFLEGQYMNGDEYEDLINDPTDYFIRKHLPRICGALSAFSGIPSFTSFIEYNLMDEYLAQFGVPEIQEAFGKLLDAGKAAREWSQAVSAIDREITASFGLPTFIAGYTKAPYDILAGNLRGMRSSMLDLFRRPTKLIAAIEKFTPLMIEMGLFAAKRGGSPFVMIPLTHGSDGFMSRKDFKSYYWPSLKAVILGLIQEGVVPCLRLGGYFNLKLDLFVDSEIPIGKTIWIFENTSMREVKKHLSDWACFGGGIPIGILSPARKPEETKYHVKNLISEFGQNGGFLISNGYQLNETTPECLHALIDECRRSGGQVNDRG